MKRIFSAVVILTLAISGTLVAARLLRKRPAQAPVRPSSLPPRQPSPGPVSPPSRAMGAIMIGNGNGFTVIRAEPHEDTSYLLISFSGKGEILLKDAQLRLAGFDPGSGRLLNQIANSSYDEGDQIDDDDDDAPASGSAAPEPSPEPKAPSGLADNEFRRLEIGQPAPGVYLLTVMPDAGGVDQKYSLEVSFSNQLRNSSFAEFKDVVARPGSVNTYKLQIPSEAAGDVKLDRIQP